MSVQPIEIVKPLVPPSVRRLLNRTIRAPGREVLRRGQAVAEQAVHRAFPNGLAGESFHPIFEISDQDIAIIGAMKSGNVWFRHLAAGAMFGVDIRRAPPRLVQLLIPNLGLDRYYRRYGPTVFFLGHDLPRPEFRRVVYLLRDGRDATVSMYHHLLATRGEGRVDFLRMVRDGEGLYPCKWHEHVQAWRSNPYGADMITLRYEDLRADGVRELQRFCEFVGVERDRETLEAAVAGASFESMRSMEGRFGAQTDQRWSSDKPFVRRGEVGSFRDEMSPEVLAAFMIEAEQTLMETGYLTA